MDYGLWFPIYVDRNKTRKKVVLASDLYWDYFSYGLIPMLSDYTSIESWSVSGFILHLFSLSNSF